MTILCETPDKKTVTCAGCKKIFRADDVYIFSAINVGDIPVCSKVCANTAVSIITKWQINQYLKTLRVYSNGNKTTRTE